MDEREHRHALANAQAAVYMIQKALAEPSLAPEKRERAEAMLLQAQARLAELEANRTDTGENPG